MSAYAQAIEVVQAGFDEAGIRPITSLSDAGRRASLANRRYEGVVRAMLEREFIWSFAWREVALTLDATLTEGRWKYRYTAPAQSTERIRTAGVVLASPIDQYPPSQRWRNIDYGVGPENKIFSNYYDASRPPVEVQTFRAPESDWSSLFAEAVVKKMAAIFRGSLLSDRSGRRALDDEAENALSLASAVNSNTDIGRYAFDTQAIDAWQTGYRTRR